MKCSYRSSQWSVANFARLGADARRRRAGPQRPKSRAHLRPARAALRGSHTRSRRSSAGQFGIRFCFQVGCPSDRPRGIGARFNMRTLAKAPMSTSSREFERPARSSSCLRTQRSSCGPSPGSFSGVTASRARLRSADPCAGCLRRCSFRPPWSFTHYKYAALDTPCMSGGQNTYAAPQ